MKCVGVEFKSGGKQYTFFDNDIDINQEFNPIGLANNIHKLIFIFDNEEETEKFINKYHNNIDYKKFNGMYQVNLSSIYGK